MHMWNVGRLGIAVFFGALLGLPSLSFSADLATLKAQKDLAESARATALKAYQNAQAAYESASQDDQQLGATLSSASKAAASASAAYSDALKILTQKTTEAVRANQDLAASTKALNALNNSLKLAQNSLGSARNQLSSAEKVQASADQSVAAALDGLAKAKAILEKTKADLSASPKDRLLISANSAALSSYNSATRILSQAQNNLASAVKGLTAATTNHQRALSNVATLTAQAKPLSEKVSTLNATAFEKAASMKLADAEAKAALSTRSQAQSAAAQAQFSVTRSKANLSKLQASVSKTLGDFGTADIALIKATAAYQAALLTQDAAALLASTLPSSVAAGSSLTITLTVLNSAGNVATQYSNPALISSSDKAAVVPQSVNFTQGVAVFSVVPKTAGTFTLTAETNGVTLKLPAVSIVPGAPSKIVSDTKPGDVSAGSSTHWEVHVEDAYGNFATNSSVTLTLSSTDGNGDAQKSRAIVSGSASFDFLLRTAGTQTLTLQGNALTQLTSNVTVTSAAPASLEFSGLPTSLVAGTRSLFTVTARDAYGNLATQAYGSPTLTSSDSLFVVDSVTSFSGAVAQGYFTLKTAGSRTITASNGGLSITSGGMTVSPLSASQLTLGTITSTVTAGSATSFTVTAKDIYGNTATGFGSQVSITSSDSSATLPSSSVLSNGTGTFSVTLKTAGVRTITASGGALSVTSGSITVNPGSAASLALQIASSTVAGSSLTATLTAKDSSGNTATGFSGSIALSTTDSAAVLPASVTASNGAVAAVVTFKTAGSRTLTATSGSMSITSGSISVTPANASQLVLGSVPASATAGTSFSFSVTAKDPYGNTATAFSSSVTVTSSDSAATLPSAATPSNGATSPSITLKTAGSRTLTASAGGLSVTSSAITVSPGSASTLSLSGIPATTTAGTAFTGTITAKDAFGNTATGASNSVSLSSTDSLASIPSSVSLSSGVGSFSVTLKGAGARTITASATGLVSASASSTVSAAAVSAVNSTLSVSSSQVISGNTITLTLTAKDAYGNSNPSPNPATSNLGFSISAVGGSGTFSAATHSGGGVYTATFTGTKAGAATISASISGTLVSNSVPISISAGTAKSLAIVSIVESSQAGDSFQITLNALDAWSNLATSYSSPISITSSDPKALGTGQFNASAGVMTTSIVLLTSGDQTLTLKPVSGPVTTAVLAKISVAPGPLARIETLGDGSSGTANSDYFELSITAFDDWNNKVPIEGYWWITRGGGTLESSYLSGSSLSNRYTLGKLKGLQEVTVNITSLLNASQARLHTFQLNAFSESALPKDDPENAPKSLSEAMAASIPPALGFKGESSEFKLWGDFGDIRCILASKEDLDTRWKEGDWIPSEIADSEWGVEYRFQPVIDPLTADQDLTLRCQSSYDEKAFPEKSIRIATELNHSPPKPDGTRNSPCGYVTNHLTNRFYTRIASKAFGYQSERFPASNQTSAMPYQLTFQNDKEGTIDLRDLYSTHKTLEIIDQEYLVLRRTSAGEHYGCDLAPTVQTLAAPERDSGRMRWFHWADNSANEELGFLPDWIQIGDRLYNSNAASGQVLVMNSNGAGVLLNEAGEVIKNLPRAWRYLARNLQGYGIKKKALNEEVTPSPTPSSAPTIALIQTASGNTCAGVPLSFEGRLFVAASMYCLDFSGQIQAPDLIVTLGSDEGRTPDSLFLDDMTMGILTLIQMPKDIDASLYGAIEMNTLRPQPALEEISDPTVTFSGYRKGEYIEGVTGLTQVDRDWGLINVKDQELSPESAILFSNGSPVGVQTSPGQSEYLDLGYYGFWMSERAAGYGTKSPD